jgi:hypothetical protein
MRWNVYSCDRLGGGLFVGIPHKEVGAARREINRLSRDWPRNGGELKGGILEPTHLESLVEVLFRHDALMHACAIGVSREDDARVDRHKARQCDGMTKHLTPEHHAELVRQVWDLRRVLEGMSRQLYIQCVMMKELRVRAQQQAGKDKNPEKRIFQHMRSLGGRLTPSCGGHAPTAERTVGPARNVVESLTSKPGIREQHRS